MRVLESGWLLRICARGLALVVWSATAAWAPGAAQHGRMAQQRCWNHKIINVLDDLPKRVQPLAKPLLTQIPYAASREAAEKGRDQFAKRFGGQFPKAVATLERDWERMVSFYDYPEAHWKHLRTTNPVESPFASVRLRTNAGKRYKRVAGATALIWRVLMVAEQRFRTLNGAELLPDVYAGVRYKDGKPIDPEETSPEREGKQVA